jgi:hypothetical protein
MECRREDGGFPCNLLVDDVCDEKSFSFPAHVVNIFAPTGDVVCDVGNYHVAVDAVVAIVVWVGSELVEILHFLSVGFFYFNIHRRSIFFNLL